MSNDLSRECTNLLKSTKILSHQYGIPKLQPPKSRKEVNVHQLESKYFDLYKQLNHKLNRLMYLVEIKKISTASQLEIDEELTQIKTESNFHEDNEQLFEFLMLQNNEIKTNKLLNNYMLTTTPILKAIHQHRLNVSEKSILKSLNDLYDEQNGLVFKTLNDRLNPVKKIDNYGAITFDVLPLIETTIQLNKQLIEMNREYVKSKEQMVSTTDEFQTGVRSKYSRLLHKWNQLKQITLFIPLMVTSLPIDWYNDDDCLEIMRQTNYYNQKLEHYHSYLNDENFSAYTDKELMSIEF